MIKLIASDLDGTLLHNGAQILNPEIFDLIKKLTQKGIIFVAASGRQYGNLQRLFEPVKDDIAYICENGALVMYKDNVISKTVIPRELGLKIMEDIWNYDTCEILLSGQNTSYLKPKTQEYVHLMKNVVKNNVEIVENIEDVKEDFLKISIYEKIGIAKNSGNHFLTVWGDKVQAAISGFEWLDYTIAGTNKGSAIKSLQKFLNIDFKETMAFGDNFNDIEMLQSVFYSYAMKNAKDEVKKIAKFETEYVENILKELLN